MMVRVRALLCLGLLLSSRFAVTFVVERDGHFVVAAHDPSRGVRFRGGDPMGEVF